MDIHVKRSVKKKERAWSVNIFGGPDACLIVSCVQGDACVISLKGFARPFIGP